VRRQNKKTWVLRAVGAGVLALTFGYVPYHIYGRSGFARYLELRRELTIIQAENGHMRGENQRLTREADALRSDRRVLEREARAQLNWVRPGEVIFDLGGER
jgi:cell division protein FtsB